MTQTMYKDLIVKRDKARRSNNDYYSSRCSYYDSKKRNAYYLSASAFTSHPGMQISKILSHVVSLRRRTFFPLLSCQEKVPVYYLNNGSRACVIVSPLFLFRRLTLLVNAERRNEKGRGLFCFESRKKTERADGGRGGKGAEFRAG